MQKPVTITVKWDAGRLAKNVRFARDARRHEAIHRDLSRQAKIAATAGYRSAGCPMFVVPVTVQVTIRRGCRLDDDGATAGIAAARDSIFNRSRSVIMEGVVPEDSGRWTTWLPLKWETGKAHKGREEIIFEITPAEEDQC